MRGVRPPLSRRRGHAVIRNPSADSDIIPPNFRRPGRISADSKALETPVGNRLPTRIPSQRLGYPPATPLTRTDPVHLAPRLGYPSGDSDTLAPTRITLQRLGYLSPDSDTFPGTWTTTRIPFRRLGYLSADQDEAENSDSDTLPATRAPVCRLRRPQIAERYLHQMYALITPPFPFPASPCEEL